MSFIQKIQNSNESTKRRWVMALSGFSMAIVIIAWAIYMNSYMEAGLKSERIEKIGIWQVFRAGLKVSKSAVSEKIVSLFSKISSEIPEVGSRKNILIENP